MLISINDIGKNGQEDALAKALMSNKHRVVSLNIDWTMHPEKICESIGNVQKSLMEKGNRMDGFAGTGLGAVIALIMASCPKQRWLALDIPTKPVKYFKNAIEKHGIEIPRKEMKEILKWLKIAEEHLIDRIMLFMNPEIKLSIECAGESILAMSKDDKLLKKKLLTRQYDYVLVQGADKLEAVMF